MGFNGNRPLGPGRSFLLAGIGGDVFFLLLLVLAALLLRYLAIPPYQVIAADGPSYVAISRQIFERLDFTGSIHYPPFYPVLIGLAKLLLPDYEAAGKWVSLIMGSLLPLPVFLLGRGLYGRGTGYVAAAMILVWPEFIFQSSTVLAFSTYFTLLTTGLWLLWSAQGRKSPVLAAASGLIFAAAYLTRQEAFISLVAACFCLAMATFWRERTLASMKPLLVACGVFAAAVFPYVLMVHNVMGVWTMAGKSVVTLTDALGYYLNRFDLNREPGFAKIGIMDLIRDYPGYFPYIFKVNFAELRTIVPLPFLIAAAVGFFFPDRGERRADVRWFIAGGLFPVFILLTVFLVSSAYVAPYLPFVFILCGHGMVSLEKALLERFVGPRPAAGSIPWLSAAIVLCYVLYGAWQVIPRKPPPPYTLQMDGGRYDEKLMGMMLKKYLPPGSLIMTRSGRIAFYSGLPRVDIPQADFETIIRTAREQKVRYLVVDGRQVTLRPQLGRLLEPLQGPESRSFVILPTGQEILPGLFFKMFFTDYESQGVAVYEFNP